jgi:hypothetical protein
VLDAALALLDIPSGPVLEDFPDDAPPPADAAMSADGVEDEGWTCPIPLAPPPADTTGGDLGMALRTEIAQLSPWYELSVADRGRTTVGASGLPMAEVGMFISRVLDGDTASPIADLTVGEALKLAVEDLRAYYFEAAGAQPGRRSATGAEVREWFWRETVAARVLWALQPICAASTDSMMQAMAKYILIPRSALGGVGDNPEYAAD